MVKTKRTRMYAVSADDVGLIAGTLAYSRGDAIAHFLGGYGGDDWGQFKRSGYRTVPALVEVVDRFGTRRTTRR